MVNAESLMKGIITSLCWGRIGCQPNVTCISKKCLLFSFNFHLCVLLETPNHKTPCAAIKRNESAMAIQPPQADQPTDSHNDLGLTNTGHEPDPTSFTAAVMGGVAILAIVVLAIGLAAAPIAKHSKFTSILTGAAPPGGRGSAMNQTESRHRLVGE